MSDPKRHHYIPQMVLRRFCDETGALHCFNKTSATPTVFSTTPENAFVVGNLYTQYSIEGKKDLSLEKAFSSLESDAEEIIEKMINSARKNSVPKLSAEQLRTWNGYFYYQWKRVPQIMNKNADALDEMIDDAVGEFEQKYRRMTDEERALLEDADYRNFLKKNARVRAVAEPGLQVQKILNAKGITIGQIKNMKASFVIGSTPIVRLGAYGRTHLTNPLVETWLPISPDIAVTPFGARGEERLLPIKDAGLVRRVNMAVFKQSTIIAGRSAALLSSLANAR